MKKYSLMIIILCVAMYGYAGIYQQKQNSGGVLYTDMPSGTAKQVNPGDDNNSITNQAAASSEESAGGELKEVSGKNEKTYTEFYIESPKDQEVIQNQPFIPIHFKLQPELKNGDVIQLVIDGVNYGSPTIYSKMNIGFVERGAHQLYAVVMNNHHAIVRKTPMITINVHRNSIITSPASK